jgi:nitrite reductase/ring-hydroxylating ferredoxin subunit
MSDINNPVDSANNASIKICHSEQLIEGELGHRFEVRPDMPAFVIRFDGVAHAFVNRCPHAFTELDWQPGAFFDDAGLYLVCATHGALFHPETGACVAGPCRGKTLSKLPVVELNGSIQLGTDR